MKKYFGTLVIVLVGGCTSPQQFDEAWITSERSEKVRTAVQIIEACPSWIALDPGDYAAKQKILNSLRSLNAFDRYTLRRAIDQFRENTRIYDVDAMAKLFLLNRYLFAVPEWVQRENAVHFGGWTGIPNDNGRVNELWPLQLAENGQWELVVGRSLGYMGAAFDATGEFDYFLRIYGRRRR